MAALRTSAVMALTLAAMVVVATAQDVPRLPLLQPMPATCGSVVQITTGDTCDSIAAYAGISVSKLQELNPLLLCALVPQLTGLPVCTGGTLAFCNNLYSTSEGETCSAVVQQNADVSSVLAVETGANCKQPLPADTQLCVAPAAANPCAQDTICGAPVAPALQKMLAGLPDYCTVLSECKAEVATTTVNGIGALKMKLSAITPAVEAVLPNDGHPELSAFADNINRGKASYLEYTLTPGGASSGGDAVDFLGTTELPTTRKLLGGQPVYNSGPTGGVTRAYWQYY